jgi:hypothetical protein
MYSSRYCHVTNTFGAYVARFHCCRASQRDKKAPQIKAMANLQASGS